MRDAVADQGSGIFGLAREPHRRDREFASRAPPIACAVEQTDERGFSKDRGIRNPPAIAWRPVETPRITTTRINRAAVIRSLEVIRGRCMAATAMVPECDANAMATE
jgi:hypothetical protein